MAIGVVSIDRDYGLLTSAVLPDRSENFWGNIRETTDHKRHNLINPEKDQKYR
jgi:hypothetical protein